MVIMEKIYRERLVGNMMWWVLLIFIGIILLLLPLKVQLTLEYGKDGLYGSLYLLVWKKIIWKKRYDEKNIFALKKQGSRDTSAKGVNSRLKQKIIGAVKAEWSAILSVGLKKLVIEKWTLYGKLGTDNPAVKSIFCGVISAFTGWFYGSSQALLIWRTWPVQHIVFTQVDTNWQFQCMIKSSLGQIISKGIKILMILVRRSVSNGAKERNRNAHANGYL